MAMSAMGQQQKDDVEFDLTELYQEIDQAIGESPRYIARYEDEIDKVKQNLLSTDNEEQRLLMLMDLSRLYESFNGDSAQVYTERAWQAARRGGYKELEGECMARLAFLCTFLGSQTEALTLLQRMNPDSLSHDGLCSYYRAYMVAYDNLATNTHLAMMRDEFRHRYQQSNDSLLSVATPGSEMYYRHLEPLLIADGKLGEALKVNDERLNMTPKGTHQNAIVCYSRYTIYRQKGDMRMAKYWLCQSALDDIRCAVLDQMSLIALAEVLDEEGDLDRASRYISFTWECNRKFSPHMRSWQIAPLLTAIEMNYQAKIDHKSRILLGWCIALSIVMLLFVISLFYVNRQRRKMQQMKEELERNNQELKNTNEKLEILNEWMKQRNAQ